MGELLDLLDAGPMIALAIACVLMVSVVVVVVLQARRISRLEDRLAERGDAADDAPLQRIAELQARNEISQGSTSVGAGTFPWRQVAMIGGTAVVLLLAIGGVYLFVTGGDDGSGAQASAGARTDAASTRPATTTPGPRASSTIPAEIPPLDDASQYTVAVFNASGVSGAAGNGVTPRLTLEGFQVPITTDYPNGVTDLAQSVVMYSGDENRTAAWNVADLLGIDRTPPLEGLSADQTGGADVIVVVGLDTADGLAAGTTTSTATP